MDERETFDLVVIGSGAAGLTTAVVAAHQGLSVLVLEKATRFGGTTARSGAGLWIPNNPHMPTKGFSDSPQQAKTYLRGLMGNYYDVEKIDAYLDNAPEMISFLEAHSAVRFENWQNVDYEPWREGAGRGRSIGAAIFDGRRLGGDLPLIAPGLPALTIFGGMQVAYSDVSRFGSALRNLQDLAYTSRKVLRYIYDHLIYRYPTRLVGGNALIGALLLTARSQGIKLMRSTPMIRLIQEHGVVSGVVVEKDGVARSISARRGVVLATGGYGGNDSMRREFLPLAAAGWSLQPTDNVGDGINAGEGIGGQVVRDNAANGIWAAVSTMIDRQGRRQHYPHTFRDRAFPGFLMVDGLGRRFVNEGVSYQALGNLMIEKNIRSAWLICDHRALRKYGMGHVKPSPLPYRRYIRNGYLKTARTVSDLAECIAINSVTLVTTVERFNRFAREGKDPDFQKGEDRYSAEQGDPSHSPNPGVRALMKGPFYAVELFPGDFSTVNGLETDASARVLDSARRPIPHLYAVGVDANSIFRGNYPGSGASIGPGMTFGYIAAYHASKD